MRSGYITSMITLPLVLALLSCSNSKSYTDFDKELIGLYENKVNRFDRNVNRMAYGVHYNNELSYHRSLVKIAKESSSQEEAMQKLSEAGLDSLVTGIEDGLELLLIKMIDRLDLKEYEWQLSLWHFSEIYPVVNTIDRKDSVEVRVYLGARDNIVPYMYLIDTVSNYKYLSKNVVDGEIFVAS